MVKLNAALCACTVVVGRSLVEGKTSVHLRKPHVGEERNTIPRRLVFPEADPTIESSSSAGLSDNYEENVGGIIHVYRAGWDDPNFEVHFVGGGCASELAEIDPVLQNAFDNESNEYVLSSICSLAALYKNGGYFFDGNRPSVEHLQPKKGIKFAALKGCKGSCIQAGFMATAPRHPMIKQTLMLLERNYHSGVPSGKNPIQPALSIAYEYMTKSQKDEILLLEIESTFVSEIHPKQTS